MDRLCQYSTIIYSGNVCVLLIVAITTDYWEYRTFHQASINTTIRSSNTTHLIYPPDTNTYFFIRYFWDPSRDKSTPAVFPGTEAHYQPPALLHKYYTYRTQHATYRGFNGTDNVTYVVSEKIVHKYEDVIVVFQEYGNLFRDCDDLEVGVQKRLALPGLRDGRCRNFIVRRRDGFIARELPAVPHLERAAFVFAVLCIVASVVSVAGGAYGSFAHERMPVVAASTAALVSGMSLTVSIALFHGKCHLLHRRPLMAGIDLPYKRPLNAARIHTYGWSFGLAWICVVLCFVHSWMWLLKAQDIPDRFKPRRRVRDDGSGGGGGGGGVCGGYDGGYTFSILSPSSHREHTSANYQKLDAGLNSPPVTS